MKNEKFCFACHRECGTEHSVCPGCGSRFVVPFKRVALKGPPIFGMVTNKVAEAVEFGPVLYHKNPYRASCEADEPTIIGG